MKINIYKNETLIVILRYTIIAMGLTKTENYTEEQLQAAFAAVCGSGDVLPGSPEPSPQHARVVVERVVIRIQFEGPHGSGLKYLILHIPHSC